MKKIKVEDYMEVKGWSFLYLGAFTEKYSRPEVLRAKIQNFLDSDDETMDIAEEIEISGRVYRRPGVADGTWLNCTTPVGKLTKVVVKGRRAAEGLIAETQNSLYLILFGEQNRSDTSFYEPLCV